MALNTRVAFSQIQSALPRLRTFGRLRFPSVRANDPLEPPAEERAKKQIPSRSSGSLALPEPGIGIHLFRDDELTFW